MTYPCVPVGLKPLPRAILGIDHDRINIVHRAVVLAGPLETGQRGVGCVARVETAPDPLADELGWLDGLELVVDGGDGGLVNMARRLGEFRELLLGSVMGCQLKDFLHTSVLSIEPWTCGPRGH